jgi:hypothetical protein
VVSYKVSSDCSEVVSEFGGFEHLEAGPERHEVGGKVVEVVASGREQAAVGSVRFGRAHRVGDSLANDLRWCIYADSGGVPIRSDRQSAGDKRSRVGSVVEAEAMTRAVGLDDAVYPEGAPIAAVDVMGDEVPAPARRDQPIGIDPALDLARGVVPVGVAVRRTR